MVKNLVYSVSGNNGSFTLARSPEKMNFLDIVEAIESKIHSFPNSGLIKTIFGHTREEIALRGEKVLTNVFEKEDEKWKEYLAKHTIADLLLERKKKRFKIVNPSIVSEN